MVNGNQEEGSVEIKPEDLDMLWQINPLAREQLHSLALRRQVAELKKELAEAVK
jgi:hypothetical protein